MQSELALISLGCSWYFDIIYQNLQMCDLLVVIWWLYDITFCACSECLCTIATWVPSCLFCFSHFHGPSTPLRAVWFHHLGSINYLSQECWMPCPSLCHAAQWLAIYLVFLTPQGLGWSRLLVTKGSRWYNLEVWRSSLTLGRTLTNWKQEMEGSLAHKISLHLPSCELFGSTIYLNSLYIHIHRCPD